MGAYSYNFGPGIWISLFFFHIFHITELYQIILGAQQQILTLKSISLLKGGRRGGGNRREGRRRERRGGKKKRRSRASERKG